MIVNAALAGVLAAVAVFTGAFAAPLAANFSKYTPADGLIADGESGALTVTWRGAGDQSLRMVLANDAGAPTIRELSIRKDEGPWTAAVRDAAFEFSIVEGYRRISEQQLAPLRELGKPITGEVVDRHKWDVFWDAPLDLRTEGFDGGYGVPPAKGVAHQPGLPRSPSEVSRAKLKLAPGRIRVASAGSRLRIVFPGAALGSFTGDFVVTVFRGTNLIQTEVEASTSRPSVAYKYDAGVRGLAAAETVVVEWNDIAHRRQRRAQERSLPRNEDRVLIRAANRILAAKVGAASIAAFPPPHIWFWAREVEVNLGNNYYRRDGDGTVAIGVGQGEKEVPEFAANWSLYSAPPGSVQHMRAYLYPTLGDAGAAIDGALVFTNGDAFPEVPGHKVLSAHHHIAAGRKWAAEGVDAHLDEFDVLRSAGVDIVTLAEWPRDEAKQLQEMDAAFKGAQRHSDREFLILPNMENTNLLGGHWDLWFSKPTLYVDLAKPRAAGQPLVTDHPTYGRTYQIGSKEDVMAMVEAEDMLVFMPHPRTKGSTGYPEAVKDSAIFRNDRYRGAGWRWGMGLDLSEVRMSEKRVLSLLDDMNNWAAQGGYKPKFLQAISEAYWKKPGDDVYGSSPIQYVKLAALPTGSDYAPVIRALAAGEYFMSTGEVRLDAHGLRGSGARATYSADVAWTFPLDFVEVVWGDGARTQAKIVSAADTEAFGRRVFEIPVDLRGAKWIRFAAWDVAGNGAFTNPVALDGR